MTSYMTTVNLGDVVLSSPSSLNMISFQKKQLPEYNSVVCMKIKPSSNGFDSSLTFRFVYGIQTKIMDSGSLVFTSAKLPANDMQIHQLTLSAAKASNFKFFSCCQQIRDSIVVSIPACHAGDRGSIPRHGELFMSCDKNLIRLRKLLGLCFQNHYTFDYDIDQASKWPIGQSWLSSP